MNRHYDREYTLASRARAVRRQRQLLTGVSVALVITLILAVIALLQSIEASHQRDRAQTNEQIALTNEANAIAAENCGSLDGTPGCYGHDRLETTFQGRFSSSAPRAHHWRVKMHSGC